MVLKVVFRRVPMVETAETMTTGSDVVAMRALHRDEVIGLQLSYDAVQNSATDHGDDNYTSVG